MLHTRKRQPEGCPRTRRYTMNSKTLKVCYTNKTSYSSIYHSSGYTTVPKINVEGKWLEELGFHIGDKVNIEYDEGIAYCSITCGDT